MDYLLPKLYNFFQAPPVDQTTLHDMIDGSEYKTISGPNKIPLYLGWDGAPLVKNNQNTSLGLLSRYIREI